MQKIQSKIINKDLQNKKIFDNIDFYCEFMKIYNDKINRYENSKNDNENDKNLLYFINTLKFAVDTNKIQD